MTIALTTRNGERPVNGYLLHTAPRRDDAGHDIIMTGGVTRGQSLLRLMMSSIMTSHH